VTQRIGSNRIANTSITTSKIVDGAIVSNDIASNINLSIIRVQETANVYATAIGGNVNIDIGNNTVYYFTSNTTANVTFNFRANNSNGGNLDSLLSIGQSVSSAILLKQGAIKYRANVYIDSALQTPLWLGNSAPGYATSQQESVDTYSFNI
jgi:hypothetical protein